VREGNAVLVVLPYEGPLRPELERSGVVVRIQTTLPVVERADHGALWGLIKALLCVPVSFFVLLSLMVHFKPHIVHTNTALILTPGMVACIARIPHVWHVREFFEDFSQLWKWYQRYMQLLADKIICVSTAVASQFHEEIRRRKVVVIHNGFPREEFDPVEPERVAAFRQKYGVDRHILVGVVGRIKYGRKGQDVFVKAAALLKDRFPEARFLLIGSPFPGNEEHLKNLRVLISELGIEQSVVYTGDVEDIKAACAALDISVLPSARPEPFGGVVIESMAFGKPVIGTRIGGTIEQVDDARTGLLIEPNDPQALADAMEKLLKDPQGRMAMGKLGYERFMSHFEFEEFFGKIMQLYRQQAHLGGVR
jgi:glycosyltransferase involved in cell wall biosynthesis